MTADAAATGSAADAAATRTHADAAAEVTATLQATSERVATTMLERVAGAVKRAAGVLAFETVGSLTSELISRAVKKVAGNNGGPTEDDEATPGELRGSCDADVRCWVA